MVGLSPARLILFVATVDGVHQRGARLLRRPSREGSAADRVWRRSIGGPARARPIGLRSLAQSTSALDGCERVELPGCHERACLIGPLNLSALSWLYPSWDISRDLTDRVQRAETQGTGDLAGTVHTHPGGFRDPSDQDARSTARALDANPHLDQLVVAIVTRGDPRPTDCPVGSEWAMSLHVARRSPGGGCRLLRAAPVIAPVRADLDAAGASCGPPITLEWGGRTLLAYLVSDQGAAQGNQVAVAFPAEYPQAGPIAFTVGDGGTMTPTGRPCWDPTLPSPPQLRSLIDGALRRSAHGFLDRVSGLSGELQERSVFVAGLGSVGSWMLAELVRAGVGHFTVLDPDPVEGSNLARTAYETRHVGMPKVLAAADVIRSINPRCEVNSLSDDLGDAEDRLTQLCADADLVVAATDDPSGQALLGHHAYFAGTPLISCALYRRAEAGEVVVVLPSLRTPCWHCSIGGGTVGGTRPDKDYGTGRLVGELALGPSIHVVAEVAASVAIGLLAGPQHPAGQPLAGIFATRRTVGLIATTPGWHLFGPIFEPLAGTQWAPQSVWARPVAKPDCPVCGTSPQPPRTGVGEAFRDLVDRLNSQRPHMKGA